MNAINDHVIVKAKQPDFLGKEQPHKKRNEVIIRKIILITLAVLLAVCLVSGMIAFTATFLPYFTFAAGALVAFKVLAVITGVALGTFALSQMLNFIASKLPRPLQVAANAIHAAIIEIFSLIALSASYLIDLEKSNPKKIEGIDQQPILLIHGLYHNSSAWIEYRKCLTKANIGPVFTINLGHPFSSINDHAKKVKLRVEEIQKITGRKDIMLIGHSMGGVVASKFAIQWAQDGTHVTDIITIGSPLKGSTLANYIGIGKEVQEMRKGSAFIKDLSEKICKQTDIKFFHIAAEMDELVPTCSALLPENIKAKRLNISNLGHVGLLYSKDVIDPIIDYYKNRPEV